MPRYKICLMQSVIKAVYVFNTYTVLLHFALNILYFPITAFDDLQESFKFTLPRLYTNFY